MTREQLEHLIRACGTIVDDDIVVIGSQALLGSFPDAPKALLRSMEADVYPRTSPSRAEQIDGAIGDGSRFHEAYGYYAHGVGPETPVAPAGWESRLVQVTVAISRMGTRTGWCLEPHDLMLAKLAAGRDRDWEFVEEALRHDLVNLVTLRERLEVMPISHREHVRVSLGVVIVRAAR